MKHKGAVKLEKKHPLAIRWFHWINFPVLSIMIWSGILIYWAQDSYEPFKYTLFSDKFYNWDQGYQDRIAPLVSAGKTAPSRTATEAVLEKLNPHLDHRLAEGMGWHFLFMWVFTLNGILYVLFLIFSGEWRYIVPQKGTIKDAIHTVLHDLHLRKDPPPRAKFNGAQQIAYTSIILMGGLAVLSGLALFKPVQTSPIAQLLGGYSFARIIHFVLMLSFIGFFFIHVGQVIKTGWNNFRAMVTGYELVPADEEVAA